MELQQLKYFKAVADIGKISQAAESLFVSAPALSTSISRLEKELGLQLFDRTNNRIILNAHGQILLRYVNQIFSSLEAAKQDLLESVKRQDPHISIASVNTAMWVNLITAFLSEHPQFTLSTSAVSTAQLTRFGLDSRFSFLLAYESDLPSFLAEELDSAFLFHAYPTVALHKEHPLSGEAELDIRAVTNERIFLPQQGNPMYIRLKKLFNYYSLPFPEETDYSLMLRLKMVSEKQGITFVSNSAIQAIPSPNVRYIPLKMPFEPWTARIYWRKTQPLTPNEIALRDFCLQFCQDLH